jgi:hypothetical protein
VIASSLGGGECYIRCFCWCAICCLKSVDQGAATSLHACLAPGLESANGAYFDDCAPVPASSAAQNPALAAALWLESARRVKEFEASIGTQDMVDLEAAEAAEGLPPIELMPAQVLGAAPKLNAASSAPPPTDESMPMDSAVNQIAPTLTESVTVHIAPSSAESLVSDRSG